MKLRWKRWALGGAGLLALYAVVGFAVVPWLIRNQVPKIAQEELARKGEIGEVRFNPFTLRLEAKDLRLAEADGAPLFGVAALTVDLDWNSLVRRAWSFGEIRISAPSANLAIAPDGKFNLADLIDTLERKPRKPSTDTSLPRLIVEQFAIEAGKVEMRDRQAGYNNTFTPIDFSLQNFSTLPDHKGPYTFSADSARGGKFRWKGEASVNPIRGSGEFVLENASLPELAVYLKPYARVGLAAGRMGANFPYQFAYSGGKFEASVSGAKVALNELALVHEGAKDSFATLSSLRISGISADLARRNVSVDEVKAEGGKLAVKRDPKGALDLAGMLVETPARPASGGAVVVSNWKLGVKQVVFDQVAVSAVDETVSPALNVTAAKLQLRLKLDAEQSGALTSLKVSDTQFAMSDLAVSSGGQSPVKIAQLGFTDGEVDVGARRAGVGRLYAEGGAVKLGLDRKGQLNLLTLLPKPMAVSTEPAAAGPAWVATAKSVEIVKFAADIEDQGRGITLHAQDINARLEGAGSDLKQPVKFTAGLNLREGGQLSAQGRVVPASGAVEADVRVRQLALAPAQPLLGQYLKLKLAGGNVSAQGRLTTNGKSALRYVGGFEVAGLVLNELDNELFAAWKSVGTERMIVSIAPNGLEIPELRIVEPNAKLIIEDDRSFNALRLLVQPVTGGAQVEAKPVAAGANPAAGKGGDDPFPVKVRRMRFENAKLDFADLSLRPQFGAKIHELNGVITGLASDRNTRSQIELDGRVDEFGSARIRGELNPFAPRDNTDVAVVFKNVDMVTASPYSMKFAGYKIAEGKISLDLNYKVRNSQLEGQNQIVIDKLTLGERVDSPDALKLPLELAIAILKDSDGRIDLGLPVSGNMNDPQFSYGSVVWKAIGNVLQRIVTAPFRALGALFGGGSGEKFESIEFDPGSARLLPPEREKLKQIAQVLAKRPQLKLSVPGQYSEVGDGAALKARLVRDEIAKRAGIKLAAGEEPGPLDIRDRAVRSALRGLYAERFGGAELDKAKAEAEKGAPAAPAATDAKATDAKATDAKAAEAKPDDDKLPIWQRMGKLMQGEPQVADPTAFYRKLQERLDANQPLGADALTQLGTQRANAIVAALQEGGADAGRAAAAPPEKITSAVGKAVPLKLALAAK